MRKWKLIGVPRRVFKVWDELPPELGEVGGMLHRGFTEIWAGLTLCNDHDKYEDQLMVKNGISNLKYSKQFTFHIHLLEF
jgi:hypothetical protein